VYALVLLGFTGGGAVGFFADHLWSAGSLILAAAILGALSIRATACRHAVVDPRQNAPTP
jgi:hypothetical protein